MNSKDRLVALGMAPELASVVVDLIEAGPGAGIGLITPLTDNSGGTAGNTIVDVPATYTEATLANQLASLTAKVNAIINAA